MLPLRLAFSRYLHTLNALAKYEIKVYKPKFEIVNSAYLATTRGNS